MTRKVLILFFIVMYVSVAVLALLLEWYTGNNGPLLEQQEVAQVAYAFSIACAVSSILSAFAAIRQTHWSPLIRLALLHSSSILVVFDYYLFYDANMLAFLPIFAAASLFVLLKKTE